MATPYNQSKIERGFFLLLLAIVTLLFLWLLRPFVGAIFWACVIGMLFAPLQSRALIWCRGRSSLAALTTLTICLLVCIIPILLILVLLVREGAELYHHLQSGEIDIGDYISRITLPAVRNALSSLQIDVEGLKEQLSSIALTASRYLAQQTLAIGQQTIKWFVDFGLMLYLAFFLLREGPSIVELIARALPLGDERERLLFSKFVDVTKSTIKGSLVVAIVQGSLGGIIFWILGIATPVLWGVVMAFLALVPLVGASLIWIPATVYLFVIGSWIKGIILVGFGAGVISLIDNFLRPILVGRGTKLPDYIVLFSTLGGFILFGMNGFVMGPLLAALFVTFWNIFSEELNQV